MHGPPPKNDGELIRTRQSLLGRLKDLDDEVSWREFFDIYWRLIYNVARKFGLSHHGAEDVVQKTTISVSRNIQKFVYDPERGSFKAWLLQLTRWRILDVIREQNRCPEQFPRPDHGEDGERRTDTVASIPDPHGNDLDTVWEEEWKHHLSKQAMQRVKSRVDPFHYQIFYLCVVKDLPIPEICKMFDISRERVYVIKCRVTRLIRKHVRSLEAIPDFKQLPAQDEHKQFESAATQRSNS